MQKGDKIYYRGDMANRGGWLVIAAVESTQWGQNVRMSSVDDGREIIVSASSIDSIDKGNGSTRFVTEAAYNERRAAAMAQQICDHFVRITR